MKNTLKEKSYNLINITKEKINNTFSFTKIKSNILKDKVNFKIRTINKAYLLVNRNKNC